MFPLPTLDWAHSVEVFSELLYELLFYACTYFSFLKHVYKYIIPLHVFLKDFIYF